MKKETTFLAILLFLTVGMGGCNQSAPRSKEFVTIDFASSYPEKELILQDFMDLEYIPLETNDEFVTQGDVLAIGDKYILVKNWINDGDIFVFDRNTGKGLRKINRKGQGAEEYNFINGIVLDEDNDEIFVNNSASKKINVYDLSGNFKRSFAHTKGAEYLNIFNYDNDNLICYDISGYYKNGEHKDNQSYHVIISKMDGSVTRNISIPFDVIKAPVVKEGDGLAVTSVPPIIPYHDNWLLVETSSDTIYNYLTNTKKLTPFIVSPPSSNPEIFLTMGIITDRFYFIKTIKKIFDFSKGRGFPSTDLMYDKQEKALFSTTVFNDDFLKKQEVDMTSNPINGKIASFQGLPATLLVEAYKNDELKGKLKEIAMGLVDDSNLVVMLMKYKK